MVVWRSELNAPSDEPQPTISYKMQSSSSSWWSAPDPNQQQQQQQYVASPPAASAGQQQYFTHPALMDDTMDEPAVAPNHLPGYLTATLRGVRPPLVSVRRSS